MSGLWNNFAKLGLPVVALACLTAQSSINGTRIAAALAGAAGLLIAIAALAALLHSESSARRLGLLAARAATTVRALIGRGPVSGWERATVKFRARTTLLLTARWRSLTVVTIASHLALFLVLLLALRHVGVAQEEVGAAEALAVFAIARLLTAIPLTPGGVGVVEVALVAGLARAGGADEQVVAAVLVFRTLTYLLPVPLGVLCYLFWRRNTSWRRSPGQAPRTELVPEAA
ncbi:MAG: putative Phosphatidylglycerol lysyltransferase [Frankiales bacterium]|nr:putative Phosphatidylglycerol lysyltransferase [Frankiales bacterium]